MLGIAVPDGVNNQPEVPVLYLPVKMVYTRRILSTQMPPQDLYMGMQGHIADKHTKRRRSGHRSSSGVHLFLPTLMQ